MLFFFSVIGLTLYLGCQ